MSARDKPEKPKVTTRTITRKDKTIQLTRDNILELLWGADYDIPTDATVEFRVPGGGDFANCNIDIDEDNPVIISFTTVEEE